ncbi:MAG: response regulator transcription factor, partial [Holophagales bacterium]|nr:response regulator transcription factor [Holophagales bacterium]
VRAVLRRVTDIAAEPEPGDRKRAVLEHGPLRLDPESYEVSWAGRPLTLTVTEHGLLRTLLSRPGRVFTRDELMQHAYREHVVVSDRTINSHVKRLRRKLAAVGAEPIETVHGVGYRLSPDP